MESRNWLLILDFGIGIEDEYWVCGFGFQIGYWDLYIEKVDENFESMVGY